MSVLSQTYRNFELIVVDDGSTDQTDKVVISFDDERISYIRNDENLGVAAARNVGIEAAKGKYIAFQDSDDEWLPRKLEMQVKVLENASQDVGAVYTDMLTVNKDGTVVYYIAPEISSRTIINDKTRDFRGAGLFLQETLIKRECFDLAGVFDVAFRNLVDLDFFIRMIKYVTFLHIREPGIIYHPTGGISTNRRDYAISRYRLLVKYSEEIHLANIFPTAIYKSIIIAIGGQAIRGFAKPILPQSTQRRRLCDQGLSKIRSFAERSTIFQKMQAYVGRGKSGSGAGSFENFRAEINSGLATICAQPAYYDQWRAWYAIENLNGTLTRWIAGAATLMVYSNQDRCAELSLLLHSFYCQRSLTIRLNGEEESDNTMVIPTEPVLITIMLRLKNGFNSVELMVPSGCQRPCDIPELKNPDYRCLSIAFQQIRVREHKLIRED